MLLPQPSFSYSKMILWDYLHVQEHFFNIKSSDSTATLQSWWWPLLVRRPGRAGNQLNIHLLPKHNHSKSWANQKLLFAAVYSTVVLPWALTRSICFVNSSLDRYLKWYSYKRLKGLLSSKSKTVFSFPARKKKSVYYSKDLKKKPH